MKLTLKQELRIYKEALKNYKPIVLYFKDNKKYNNIVELENIVLDRFHLKFGVFICYHLQGVMIELYPTKNYSVLHLSVFFKLMPKGASFNQPWFDSLALTYSDSFDFDSRLNLLKKAVKVTKQLILNEKRIISIEEEHNIYVKALELYRTKSEVTPDWRIFDNRYLCHLIPDVTHNHFNKDIIFTTKRFKTDFPVFMSFKPKGINYNDAWFDLNSNGDFDYKSRVKLLEKCVKKSKKILYETII